MALTIVRLWLYVPILEMNEKSAREVEGRTTGKEAGKMVRLCTYLCRTTARKLCPRVIPFLSIVCQGKLNGWVWLFDYLMPHVLCLGPK